MHFFSERSIGWVGRAVVLEFEAGVMWWDGGGVKKLLSAMVDRLPLVYVGFSAATGNPTDDSVLCFVFSSLLIIIHLKKHSPAKSYME